MVSEKTKSQNLKPLEEVYGPDFAANTSIITMAPELPGALDVIKTLTDDHDITVAIGMYECTHQTKDTYGRIG